MIRLNPGGIALRLPLLLAATACFAVMVGAQPLNRTSVDDEGLVFFESRIRPLLADNCLKCHGAKKSKARLRLDSGAGMLRGGTTGPALVPGKPAESLLLKAVSYEDPDLQMPPRDKLDQKLIDDLKTWIAMGAPVPEARESKSEVQAFDLEARLGHWSYQPVTDPELPRVSAEAWSRRPLDRFILAGLEAQGLAPAPESERYTWMRRTSYDLTGLPPSPDEMRAFLSDTAEGAYGRVVDRLLASPQFGVRWARSWLDLVGYADTRGHEFDHILPNAFEYRDYLVRAFNADLPYDQFLTEHLAGDLLPEPRTNPNEGFDESVLATGWWWLGEEVHSPVSTVADQADRISTRIDVLGRAFLGQTIACARCHDHRFDPITQRDFYALTGFMRSGNYSQVRYETRLHNVAVAGEIKSLRGEHATALVREAGQDLQASYAHADRYLLGSQVLLSSLRDEYPGWKASDLRGVEDVLFEDFEGPSFMRWSAEGEAFGSKPIAVADLPEHQGDVKARGKGLVNSHNGQTADGARASDELIGDLTSDAFLIGHDFIHCMIGGGNHEGTALQLLIDGKVVRDARGKRQNQMRHARLDVKQFRGKTARLRVHDSETGEWGNIGVDHIVFSNRSDASVLNLAFYPHEFDEARNLLTAAAAWEGLDEETLLAWAIESDGARGKVASPLHAWAVMAEHASKGMAAAEFSAQLDRLCADQRRRARAETDRAAGRLIHDFGAADAGELLQNGFAFEHQGIGALQYGNAEQPIAGVNSMPAAVMDPLWRRLRAAGGTDGQAGGVRWLQAGRTLRSLTFKLEIGKVFYLVRGAGSCYAAVDQHRLIAGPLHGRLIKRFDTKGEWQWIEQDLRVYKSHPVHLEFSPNVEGGAATDLGGGAPFAVARVVEAETRPPLPLALVAPLAASLPAGSPGDLEALARSYRDAFQRSAYGYVRLAETADALSADEAQLLDWLGRHHELHDGATAQRKAAERYAAAMRPLVDRIRSNSRLAPAMQEGSANDAPFLLRGNPRTAEAAVPRRFLTALNGEQEPYSGTGSGRLDLARRLTDFENPFFARVLVNRLWHQMFGRGLVASVDDFGVMGSAPSHPELLDHLAQRFKEGGYSVKALLRELTLSSTYRQSSRSTAQADELDPKNLLLHEMPVRRLSAEAIRDGILSASGTLDLTLHGRAVPVHLTKFMEGRGRPGRNGPLDGNGRRSLYISVRRNFLVPFFQVFDFPSPATCAGRRSVSNVPAQALTLMNDPFVIEEARRWAQRLLESGVQDPAERVHALYATAFGRPPLESESQDALAFIAERTALAGVPNEEQAVWADLCHVLFNVKEFVFLD